MDVAPCATRGKSPLPCCESLGVLQAGRSLGGSISARDNFGFTPPPPLPLVEQPHSPKMFYRFSPEEKSEVTRRATLRARGRFRCTDHGDFVDDHRCALFPCNSRGPVPSPVRHSYRVLLLHTAIPHRAAPLLPAALSPGR